MADMTTTLKVLISATNQSQAAFGQINNSLNGLKTAVLGVASAVAGGLAFRDVIESTRSWANAVDTLQDELGLAATEASKLNYIGRAVGLTTEELSQTFGILNKRVGDSLEEIVKGRSAFDEWGISLRDGRGGVVGLDEALSRVKTRFQELGQGSISSKMLVDLFGKSGKQLSDFLALSDAEMKTMIADAQAFGLILDGPASEALQKFNRDLYRFDLQMQGLKLAIGQALLPVLSGFLEKVRQGTGWLKVFGEAFRYISGIAKLVADAVGRLVVNIGEDGLLGALKEFGGDIGAIVLKVLKDIGTKLDSLGPLGEIAKDALIALGAIKVISAIADTVTAIGNIAIALRKLPARTVLLVDVVLIGIALDEISKTVHVISDDWEKWRQASHRGMLEMQDDGNNWGRITIQRLVEWGDAFDELGKTTQAKLAEWKVFFDDFGTTVQGVWTGVVSAVRGAFDQMVAMVRNSINDAIGNLNRLVQAINDLPVGPDFPFAPYLPTPPAPAPPAPRGPGQPFASGGIVTRPTRALIGEAGPEAVIPLNRAGALGGVTINVTINGGVDSRERIEEISDVLMRRLFAQRSFSY